jgi:predicted RNA-binding protein associated with RNAse of E/G family
VGEGAGTLPYTETKRRLNGTEQAFETALIVATRGMAAVRFDFTDDTYSHAGGFEIPPGSYTTGFFWRDRTYNLYHITRADGSPIADRFDVVEAVRLRRDGLAFTDLLLDFWVSALGEAHFEDEDEVEAYRERGLLTERQFLTIERTGRYLARNHQRLIAAALVELARAQAAGRG